MKGHLKKMVQSPDEKWKEMRIKIWMASESIEYGNQFCRMMQKKNKDKEK